MKEITVYKCQCGEIYEHKNLITICKYCGIEICPECGGFEDGLCWNCNDELCKIIDNVENDTLFEEHSRQLIAEFKNKYNQMKELGQLL
jgi:hypothetical protein